jgi:hypothetical protein
MVSCWGGVIFSKGLGEEGGGLWGGCGAGVSLIMVGFGISGDERQDWEDSGRMMVVRLVYYAL